MPSEVHPCAVAPEQASAESSPDLGGPALPTLGAALTGTLVGFASNGAPLVDLPAGPTQAHWVARSCVDLDADDVGKEVVLLLDDGDLRRPIVLAVVRPLAPARGAAAVGDSQLSQSSDGVRVEIDGRTVQLTGQHSVVLRCGDASITLQRDGKIVLRGTHLVSQASGVNRIRGGSIQLN